MRLSGILVLSPLLLLLCGPLPLANTVKQDDLQFIEYEKNDRAYWKPYALALRRETRDVLPITPTGATDVVKTVLLKAVNLPTNAREMIATMIQRILSAIAIASYPFLLSARLISNAFVQTKYGGPLCTIEQLVPSVIANPSGILQQSLNRMEEYARKQAASFLEQALIATWRFISTTGLPWLHRTLDRVQQLPNMPDSVRMMIKSFNAFYSIAQLLGWVSPAY